MFGELVELIKAQTKLLIAHMDELNAANKLVQDKQTAMLVEILAAVTLPAATTVSLSFTIDGKTQEGANIQMGKVVQNATGTILTNYKTDSGAPGKIDGPVVWAADPADGVTLTPSADTRSCAVHTEPVAADVDFKSVDITSTADVDLGDGVKPLIGVANLLIYDPSTGATIVEMTVGEFTPDTPSEPAPPSRRR